jgi:hypothetical protein
MKDKEIIEKLKREAYGLSDGNINLIQKALALQKEEFLKTIDDFFERKRIHYGKPATELNKALSYEMLRLSEELKLKLQNQKEY